MVLAWRAIDHSSLAIQLHKATSTTPLSRTTATRSLRCAMSTMALCSSTRLSKVMAQLDAGCHD